MFLSDKKYNEVSDSFETIDMTEPQFSYSEKLNTCLYYGGYNSFFAHGGIFETRWVKDSFSNKVILSGAFTDKTDRSKIDEFKQKVNNLMQGN